MLSKYIVNPYTALLLVSLWTTCKHSYLSWRFMPLQTSCEGFNIYFLSTGLQHHGDEMGKRGNSQVLIWFWERVFSSLCGRETMPKLDFVKIKIKTRQNRIALGNAISNTAAWDWCMGTWNSPGSLKSMNIHCMTSVSGPVTQMDTWWLGHRTIWQWLAVRLKGSSITCLCTNFLIDNSNLCLA